MGKIQGGSVPHCGMKAPSHWPSRTCVKSRFQVPGFRCQGNQVSGVGRNALHLELIHPSSLILNPALPVPRACDLIPTLKPNTCCPYYVTLAVPNTWRLKPALAPGT